MDHVFDDLPIQQVIFQFANNTFLIIFYWLVVLTILKKCQWEGLSHRLWKIKKG